MVQPNINAASVKKKILANVHNTMLPSLNISFVMPIDSGLGKFYVTTLSDEGFSLRYLYRSDQAILLVQDHIMSL